MGIGSRIIAVMAIFAMSSPLAALEWVRSSNGMNGGLIYGIYPSPDFVTDRTLFAMTMRDGLYRSRDAGVSWEKVSGEAFLTSDVSISPGFRYDRTIFAVIDGAIFKSTDGGGTWSHGPLWKGINSVAVSPEYHSDGMVLIADGTGIRKSTDGGVTWGASIPVDPAVRRIAFSPAFYEDGTIFAATPGRGIFRSIDRGATWESIGPGSLFVSTMVVSHDFGVDRTIFASTPAGVQRSTDGGDSWTALSGIVYPADGLALSPNFGQDRTLFASCYFNGLLRSTDGGDSWSPIGQELPDLPIRAIALSPDFAADGYMFAGFHGPGIWRSRDAGASWYPSSTGSTGSDILALASSGSPDETLFASAGGLGIFRSIDRGATWTFLGNGLPPQPAFYALAVSPAFEADRTVLAAGKEGTYLSADGGDSWTKTLDPLPNPTPPPDTVPFTAVAFSPRFSTDRTAFVGTANSRIFRSTDGGVTWGSSSGGIPADGGEISSIAVSPAFATDRIAFAGTTGRGMFRSSSGGSNWSAASSGLTNLHVSWVAVSPQFASDQTVFATTQYGPAFRSSNSGWTWINVGGFDTIEPTASGRIAFSPGYATDGTIYMGLSNIFVSTSRGNPGSWAQIIGVPWGVRTGGLVIAGDGSGKIYEGTMGQGIFTSCDPCGPLFRRADVEGDGSVNLADPIGVLSYLFFLEGAVPGCLKAADANDDGFVDIADAVRSLLYLYSAGLPPPAPFPACGVDVAPDDLPCDSQPSCASL
jgi:photosystem II stability/assembly factor-like uncharacterized protein